MDDVILASATTKAAVRSTARIPLPELEKKVANDGVTYQTVKRFDVTYV